MLSVIIPTYNRLELLLKTLDNIFKQTRVPDEVIVVDDHSTDGTYEYLETHWANRIVLLQTFGKGPGAARNTGLEAAKGNFIKFFDSDDLMTKNMLEVQEGILLRTQAPMVYSPYVHFWTKDGAMVQDDAVLQFRPIPKDMTLRDCMAYGFFAIIPAMMFRASLLKQVGHWRDDIFASEDWDYLWRISRLVDQPLHTNQCAVFYRLHGEQSVGHALTVTKRDYDKVYCLSRVLEDHKIRLKHALLIEAELYKTRKYIEKRVPKRLVLELVIQYKRLRNKLERKKTGTNWETMHGPEADPVAFETYLHLLP